MKSESFIVQQDGPERFHLLPIRHVSIRYGVSIRTLDRWLNRPDMSFPRPIIIASRRYWYKAQLTSWETRQFLAQE